VRRMGTEREWSDVSSRPEPEPDLLCTHKIDGPIAFELLSLTDPELAEVQAAGTKARQEAFCTADPSVRIIRDKPKKKYKSSSQHMELLVYVTGRIITPDDVIVPTIVPWFDAIEHQFRRVWFMGEDATCRLWEAI
jgi:hypothetical protein